MSRPQKKRFSGISASGEYAGFSIDLIELARSVNWSKRMIQVRSLYDAILYDILLVHFKSFQILKK